jgi:hypothetical protein
MSDQAPRRPRDAGERDRAADADGPLEIIEEGGEAACYAHLVCPDCGAVVTEGHARGCPAGPDRGVAH